MTRPLSPDEAATVARFDAAPDAPESLHARLSLAIYHGVLDQWVRGSSIGEALAANLDPRPIADAALAVIRGES